MTSEDNGDFYCLNCLHFFRTENNLGCYEKLCQNKFFCGIAWPTQEDNILKSSHYIKSDKTPCIVCADLESLIKNIDNYKNNPEKSPITKIEEHISCGYSMSIIWAFNRIENRHSLYRRNGFVKDLCIFLREHAANAINFERKEIDTVNRRRVKIISRFNRMLHLQQNNYTKAC